MKVKIIGFRIWKLNKMNSIIILRVKWKEDCFEILMNRNMKHPDILGGAHEARIIPFAMNKVNDKYEMHKINKPKLKDNLLTNMIKPKEFICWPILVR